MTDSGYEQGHTNTGSEAPNMAQWNLGARQVSKTRAGVIRCLNAGMTPKETAQALGKSLPTIRHHIQAIRLEVAEAKLAEKE